jgi:hypothetical protein
MKCACIIKHPERQVNSGMRMGEQRNPFHLTIEIRLILMKGFVRQPAGNIPKIWMVVFAGILMANCLFLKPVVQHLLSEQTAGISCSTVNSPLHTEFYGEAGCIEVFACFSTYRLMKGKVKSSFACLYSRYAVGSANAQLNSITKACSVDWLFSNPLYLLHRVLLI